MITGMAIQPGTGRLVVAGFASTGANNDFTLARFHLHAEGSEQLDRSIND